MTKKIILDTNFLLHCITYRIDIKQELQKICNFPFTAFILDNSLKELEILKKPLALKIAKTFKILNTESKNDVDSLLIEYSKKGYLIATQDLELKRKLNKPIIIIRQRKYLQIIE